MSGSISPSRSKGQEESVDPPHAFAPGLARKKPKQDPYGYNQSQPDFSFLDASSSSRVTGTWSTIDMDTNTRQWDRRFEKEQSERSHGASSSRASNLSQDPCASPAQKRDDDIDTKFFEDSKLEVDAEVRARFVDSRKILRDNQHLSDFEKRNRRVLRQDYSKPIVNMIGNQQVNVVQPRIDDRAEYRDRSGKYIDGVNRGKMKKRYEDESSKRLQARDDEMVALTKIKKEWDDLPPAEKEQRLQKRQVNKALVSLLGAGIESTVNSDIFNYEEIPVSEML